METERKEKKVLGKNGNQNEKMRKILQQEQGAGRRGSKEMAKGEKWNFEKEFSCLSILYTMTIYWASLFC